ncbi:hypothetical protein EXE41_01020 [Halorubrum sp. SD690R]|nr:hypothetical protein EXE41_01020 [Halorubrum sp. SD690R]
MCVEIAWRMKVPYRLTGGFIRPFAPEPEFQSVLPIMVFVVSILPPLDIEVPTSLVDSRGDSDPCRSDIFSFPLFERVTFLIPVSDCDDSVTELVAYLRYALINCF